MIIFSVLCVAMFALGIGGRRCTIAALVLLVVLPFSNGFSDFTYQSGAYAYDFYFIASALRMAAAWVLSRRVARIGGLGWAAALAIVVYSIFYHEWQGWTYFLKDYRPAIFALETLVLAWRFSVVGRSLMARSGALLLVCAGGIASVLWMLFSLSGLIVHKDVFYDQNSYRYLGISTYVAVIYLVYHMSPVGHEDAQRDTRQQALLRRIAFVVSFAALLVCGGRTIITALAFVVVVANSTSPRRFLVTTLLASSMLVAFVIVSDYFGADRVAQGMSSGGAQSQFLNRFSPALDRIAEMRGLQYVIGLGFGTTFQIPWFDYRGLDTDNTFVDCAYLTFYVKYGFLGIAMLLFYYARQYRTFLDPVLSRRLGLPLFLLIVTLSVTYAVPYQSIAPGLLIGYIAIACLHLSATCTSVNEI